MEKNYCEVVKYDIFAAIKILGEEHRKFSTPQEWLHSDDDNPARILNNPLLTNYDWVYENAEKLFYTDKFNYQQYQGIDEYYTLFKVLINKYSLEDDYNRLLCNKKNHMAIEWKWKYFAINLIDFLSHAPNEILSELLNKPDVMEYFLRYPEIYDCETLSNFSYKGIEKLLECSHMATFYKNDYKKLIQLIRRNPQITIPLSIMLDSKVVKDVSRTYRIEDFYQNLYYVREQVSEDLYIEEHKKYCDEQVANIKNGILPCYEDDYNNAKGNLSLDDFRYSNRLQYQVIKRIFDRSGVEILPKDYLYKELSKYMLIGMFISRNYETDPYNLFIDIETLYEFATLNSKSLRGQYVYEVFLSYEDKTLEEIVAFYQKGKNFPLIEILYDDWNKQKYDFITELNSQIYNPTFESMTVRDGISCYDITDVEKPILVHNTSISIDDTLNIFKMIDDIKRGRKHHICLSVQDENHSSFYEEENSRGKKTLKFIYGPLIHDRVGTICHEDAYSQGTTEVEIENTNYIRRLYTMQSLLANTNEYNEIVYVVEDVPFLPIGILCEDEITNEEQDVAKKLNIPLLYRKSRENIYNASSKISPKKIYKFTPEKVLF